MKNDPYLGQFSSRLKDLVEENWKSYRAAAKELDIPLSTLTRCARGEGEPGAGLLLALSHKLNVSMSYLLGDSDDPSRVHPHPRRRQLQEIDFKRVPRIDVRAAAGVGIENGHHAIEEMLDFPQWMLRKLGISGAKLSTMRASGVSMEPTIGDGALLLVNESDTTPPGKTSARRNNKDIFVFTQEGALRAKRLHKNGPEIVVISDNPDYDPELLRGQELKRLKIIGRVVWWDNRL